MVVHGRPDKVGCRPRRGDAMSSHPAVPVALVAGLSRTAHFGVLVKGAGPLENMARINTLVLDKTGTLTDGRPQITSIHPQPGLSENDLLRFAASLDRCPNIRWRRLLY